MPATAEKTTTTEVADTKVTTATEKQEPTAEQRAKAEKGSNRMHGDMFVRAKKPEKAKEVSKEAKEEKEEKAIAEVTEKKEETTEEKKEAPAKKPTLKPTPKKEVDLEKLVKSTVEATAKAVRAEPKEKAEKAESPKENVPKRRQSEWAAIVKAEENGATHKGASTAAAEVFRAEDDYIHKWEQENPGKRFNAKASEHDDWYERHLPEWIEEASEAGESVTAQEAMEKKLLAKIEKEKIEPLQQKLSQAELRDKQREVESQVPQHIANSIGMAINAINPELLKEGSKIDESDPVAHDVLLRIGPEIADQTHEALMLFATEGRTYDAKNTLHQRIISTAEEMEKDIADHSDTEKTDPQGRTFVTRSEWNEMNSAEQNKHWIVNGPLVAMKLASESAGKAKKLYEDESAKMERMAKARGWTRGKVSNGTDKNGHAEKEEVEEVTEKPRSPSTASTTVIKPGAKTEVKVPQNGGERLFTDMFKR